MRQERFFRGQLDFQSSTVAKLFGIEVESAHEKVDPVLVADLLDLLLAGQLL